jgi:hypothetical protein
MQVNTPTATSDARIKRCLDAGTSILIATVDPQGVASSCRGIAIASADGLETATVYVPLATSQEALQNLAATRRIAVAATHPIDHCSVQLKGTFAGARLARDDEASFVRSRLDRLADVLDDIGVPRRITRRLAHWPSFAIELRVEQIFEQTPGPNAGSRLR